MNVALGFMNPIHAKMIEDAMFEHNRKIEGLCDGIAQGVILDYGYRLDELFVAIKEDEITATLSADGTHVIVNDKGTYTVSIRVPRMLHTLFARRMWRMVFGYKREPIESLPRKTVV